MVGNAGGNGLAKIWGVAKLPVSKPGRHPRGWCRIAWGKGGRELQVQWGVVGVRDVA